MKILVNRKNKLLFCRIFVLLAVFTLLSSIFIGADLKNAMFYILAASLCMGVSVLAVLYFYLKDQEQIMENAAAQIREYISGNPNARIPCEEEGELYRLFHEVNSLASILNAHAENQEKGKEFMKNTLSDISHQLKTPLAALNIYNGILQDEAGDIPIIQEFTSLSEQELDRIETLVQNLLKITKLDAGTILMEKTSEQVSDMMEYIKTHFSCRAALEGKELIFTGDDKVTLRCDRVWLLEAVSNIVKNAFDHTKAGDSIHIEWRQNASIVQILVKDTGSGIHPEDLHYIFKRFYRSRFSKDTQGIGLGLSLAKAIVEAHKGTIEAESELKKGTVFTINFLTTLLS